MIESISRKNLYLPFLKDYVIAKNCPELNRFFIITRYLDSSITLKKYLEINRTSISLETKLKFMSQILCFAYICLAKIPNLLPAFSLTNIMVNGQGSLQLASVERTNEDPLI